MIFMIWLPDVSDLLRFLCRQLQAFQNISVMVLFKRTCLCNSNGHALCNSNGHVYVIQTDIFYVIQTDVFYDFVTRCIRLASKLRAFQNIYMMVYLNERPKIKYVVSKLLNFYTVFSVGSRCLFFNINAVPLDIEMDETAHINTMMEKIIRYYDDLEFTDGHRVSLSATDRQHLTNRIER